MNADQCEKLLGHEVLVAVSVQTLMPPRLLYCTKIRRIAPGRKFVELASDYAHFDSLGWVPMESVEILDVLSTVRSDE